MSERLTLRDADPADVPSIFRIYGHHVATGCGSFELEPPSEDEMRRRRNDVVAAGLPYLVAVVGDEIVGFAYCSPYRSRAAYRFVVEDSVYVAPDALGKGIGRTLLAALIQRCEALGLRQIIAVIGDSGNAASIELHRTLGFEQVGVLRDVGWKRGRWLDTVFMERALNGGSSTSPREGEHYVPE